MDEVISVKRQRHCIKFCILLLVLLIIPFMCITFFLQYNCTRNNLTIADWLAFSGALISYVGTIVISLVAIGQSERANLLSEKVYMLTQREYVVNFAAEQIKEFSIQNCGKKYKNRVSFCEIDYPPETCKGYLFEIKNYSNYPITNICFSTSYTVGRSRLLETLEKDVDILLAPNASQEFLVCNTPHFMSDGTEIKFVISCTNIFNNLSTLEIHLGEKIDTEGNINFSTKLVESKQ